MKKYRDDDTKSLKEQAEKEISRGILGGDVQAAKQALTHVMQYVRKIENENTRQNFMISLLLLPAQLMNNMKPENMGVYASQARLLTVFFFSVVGSMSRRICCFHSTRRLQSI